MAWWEEQDYSKSETRGRPKTRKHEELEAHLVKYKSISVIDAWKYYEIDIKALSKMIIRLKDRGYLIERTRELKYGIVIGTYHFRGLQDEFEKKVIN